MGGNINICGVMDVDRWTHILTRFGGRLLGGNDSVNISESLEWWGTP
jgi:hypothetical protein